MDLRNRRVLVACVAVAALSSGGPALTGTAWAAGTSTSTAAPGPAPATTVAHEEGDPGPGLPLTVSPDRGPVGTIFTVTGPDCPYHLARVWMMVSSEHHEMISGITAHTGDDGSWEMVGQVPEGQEPDTYSVIVRCYPNEDALTGDTVGYSGRFVVTPTLVQRGREPAPAKPVKSKPAFTG